MKKIQYFIMILLGAGLILTSCNQKKKTAKEEEGSKVPETVQKAFQAKFADAKNIEWEAEEEGEYEAEFVLNNTKMSAEFSKDGTWKETETVVPDSTLPAAIADTLNTKYGDYAVQKAELTENPKGKSWEVKLKKDDSEMELVFDENGNVLKQEAGEKEEEVGKATEEHEKGEKEEKGEEEHEEGGK